ncbi:MAG TPA: response regulator, partial [Flavisolibacter sp.]|nr:response regulator [Flavisolibacter sp.]
MDYSDRSRVLEPRIQTFILADDNQADCLRFEKALMQVAPAHKLITVTNGDELLNLLYQYVPDILFIDLNMPCKNGIQCIKEIRDDRNYDDMPIIVFSATDRVNNIQVAYGMGANLFFVKPQDDGDLLRSVKQILQFDWND